MSLKKRLLLGRLSGKLTRKEAQASLEMALAIFSILLLLSGMLRFFFWANERFVLRQEAFEKSAVDAASSSSPAWQTQAQQEVQVSDLEFPPLDIFGASGRPN